MNLDKVADSVLASQINAMPMPKLVSNKLVKVGPSKAEGLLAFNNYEFQRPMKSSRIRELMTKMLDGRFTTATVCLGTLGGRTYLVNGQHTLTSIKACRINRPFSIHLLEYECSSQEELSCLWAQWDSGGARSLKEVANSYVPLFGSDWSKEMLALIGSACAVFVKGERYSVKGGVHFVSKEDRIRLIQDHSKGCEFARSIVFKDGSRVDHLVRTPVVASMLRTHDIASDEALTFWDKVRSGIGCHNESDPSYVLREYLLGLKRGSKNRYERPQHVIGKCVSAWNNFRTGGNVIRLFAEKRGLEGAA